MYLQQFLRNLLFIERTVVRIQHCGIFNTKELDVLVVIASVCYFDEVVISFKIHHISKSHAISSGLTSLYIAHV
jgi:hypothetical protein